MVPNALATPVPHEERHTHAWIPTLKRTPTHVVPAKAQRRKLIDIDPHLHCSIIGTCLSVSELRRFVVRRVGQHLAAESDLEIHEHGVRLASDAGASRDLSRELDRKFELAVKRFGRANTDVAVSDLWEEAKRSGDIPAGYWCLVTHPSTSRALLQRVVGEVHMLSHLVGASNRADIRRLADLEARCAELQARSDRQQARIHALGAERDAAVRELGLALQRALSESTEADSKVEEMADEGTAQFLQRALAGLEQRLAASERRRERAEAAGATARATVVRLESELKAIAERERLLLTELQATAPLLEQGNAAEEDGDSPRVGADLAGRTVLYVGGRPGALAAMRAICQSRACHFVHHDGGLEVRRGLLESWIAGADVVVFPVDCVSHDAVLTVKRACRQAGRPFLALRSSGVSSFIAALDTWSPQAAEPPGHRCTGTAAAVCC